MTCLQELSLKASVARQRHGDATLLLTPAASLPASLTRLSVDGMGWNVGDAVYEHMPPQIAALPNLRHLTLETVSHVSAGYAPLTRLFGSLEHLRLSFTEWLPSPATFAELTRLTSLDLDSCGLSEEGGQLGPVLSALPHLRQLRASLASCGYEVQVMSVPPALGQMGRLEDVWLDLGGEDLSLPQGPWLASLRRLVAPGEMFLHNAAALAPAAAPRLNLIGAVGPYVHADVLHFAVRQPRVRTVLLDAGAYDDAEAADVQRATRAALRQQPPKQVTSFVDLYTKTFEDLDAVLRACAGQAS